MTKKIPHVLMILDGVGHREDPRDNAVLAANTPNLDRLSATCPNGLISGSGMDVGLPDGQFGNSEVGHMNLGAGRILFQDSTRIMNDISTGEFFENAVLNQAVQNTLDNEGAVHILGLLSDGGVHAHIEHIKAATKLALQKGALQVFIHAFLDGRDTPPKSADGYVADLQKALDALNAEFEGEAKLASVIGRFYAMDRDKRWDRVQAAYELLTQAAAVRTATDGADAVAQAYAADETDEFVQATIIDDNGVICDNDGVIFMNFRADRARELSYAFVDKEFDGFERKVCPELSAYVMLTKYSDDLADNAKTSIAYEPTSLANTLGEYLQNQNKTQLRIAETEKYAHVTFFFSGGREELYTGEERILVNSPNVTTYDLKPEMSAYEVTDKLKAAIESGKFDVLIVNYANGDMVGHSGVFEAAVKAVEAVDECIGVITKAVQDAGGHLLITADHGNCEQMQDYESGQVHTQHTTELVPFIYVGERDVSVRTGGRLCDVAPTLLHLMNVDKPTEMTGESLLVDK
ncbi:phosphoglycerate mutase (2,3-diphosphoglycerate-independent) [Moraxella caviae]|uniref:2,3-bisphosphoglycerate-independent phosphoglycerate mutase n=1 Tax=Moraxella caviae TaxID=34060 RepID=A0A1T0A8Q0_9GAMM|nr:2,3-bisphosphoglycerate-independent phosphoglycerate mutase [Moraxella caviae]OOR92106.1 phosphoglycerate mutase (2,3-diphosphoglycerate-independent) [Moraxella caviae]STZ14464.1 2,3-bisphosphoglycerate-independent phosphoglycerate mutase [Moraxella caviae]